MRPLLTWKIKGHPHSLGKRTWVMGILNVTPDSFSDGGRFRSSEEAVAHGLQMLEEGADLLDIGGESTRPGVRVGTEADVSAEKELSRVLPVFEGLHRERPDLLLSIDTYKAAVARQALQAGASIVNDVSGLHWDPDMASTLAGVDCGIVLMHTRGTPQEWKEQPAEPHILKLVRDELAESLAQASSSGIEPERVVLDPGFGFGKRLSNNYPLLASFQKLQQLGRPLLAGLSRKSFLGRTAGERFGVELPANERLHPSLAAAVTAVLKGAHIVRTHDVRPTVEAAAIADAVLAAEVLPE